MVGQMIVVYAFAADLLFFNESMTGFQLVGAIIIFSMVTIVGAIKTQNFEDLEDTETPNDPKLGDGMKRPFKYAEVRVDK
jgi:hypothetical protein